VRHATGYFKSTKQQGKVDGFEQEPLKVRTEYNQALEQINEKVNEDTICYEIVRCFSFFGGWGWCVP